MKHRKIIIGLILFSLVIVTLDYIPMLYYRATGNGNTFVEHYDYNMLSKVLLQKIVDLKTNDKNLQPPNEINFLGDTVANYAYIKFFDKENKKYFHTYVCVDSSFEIDYGTELIFYGVSDTPDKDDAKRINHDYDYVSRLVAIKRFELLVKNRLDKKAFDVKQSS